jgi:UDP-glucose 4-epimerase
VAFVTGAAGFIGRQSVNALKRGGWRVVGLSRVQPGDEALDLVGPDVWITGKVSRLGLKQAQARFGHPEVLIHAAGGASVRASLDDPLEDFDRTVGSMREVLAFLRTDSPAARLIFLSSAAVYGAANAGRIREDAALRPISPYGLHKRLAEDLAFGWASQFGLDVAVVRLFSVYGPGIRKQLLWDIAQRLCVQPRAIELFGAGDELRDFLYIDDAVRLIGRLAGMERADQPLLLNGGSGEPSSVSAVAQHLCNALGVDTRVSFNGAVRAGDPRSLVADTTTAQALGFVPQVGLAEGLARFAAWTRAETGRGERPAADWGLRDSPLARDTGF